MSSPQSRHSLASSHPSYETPIPDVAAPPHGRPHRWLAAGALALALALGLAALPGASPTAQRLFPAAPLARATGSALATSRPPSTQLRVAAVTQIWPPPATAPDVAIDAPPAEGAVMEDAAPLPVVMAVVRGDADTGILSAATTTAQTGVPQYDFHSATTIRSVDKSTYLTFTVAALAVLVLLGVAAYRLLAGSADRLGVELDPRRSRDDFTAKYRPRPIQVVTAEDVRLEKQLKDEIRRRGLEQE